MRDENDWSDLLVLLAEHDAEPFRKALGLPDGAIEFRRECRTGPGRSDIVVFVDAAPSAIVEVKLGADAHGDQFAIYDAWADANGVPAGCRYVVGPTGDPIPGIPQTWSQHLTIESLLELWRDSGDGLARALAWEAGDLLVDLIRQSHGPADEATAVLADVLRLRRIHHQVWSLASEEVWFEGGNRSDIGAANICAWRNVGHERVSIEVQRLAPRAGTGTPFAFTIMVSEIADDDSAIVSPELAQRQEQWLAPRAVLHHAGDAVRRAVADPDGDGLKSGRTGGKGHRRFYGYKTTGLGTRMELRPDVTGEELALLYAHVVDYLLTYQPEALLT